jgi:hypothetical protein
MPRNGTRLRVPPLKPFQCKSELKTPLFIISENVGDFCLRWRDLGSDELCQFGVMQGTPAHTATIWATVEGDFELRLRRNDQPETLLHGVRTQSIDEGMEIIEAAMRKYEISPWLCEIVRPSHADGGD